MKIAEIYRSRQGEGRLSGTPSVFVRTSGCNLRCWFCDTPFTSWTPEGDDLSVDEVMSQVNEWDCRHVVLTGGEPMLWSELIPLAEQLREQGTPHHDRNGRHALSAGALRSDVDQPQAVELGAQRSSSRAAGAAATSALGMRPA